MFTTFKKILKLKVSDLSVSKHMFISEDAGGYEKVSK